MHCMSAVFVVAAIVAFLLITLTEAIAITIENEPKIINRSVSSAYPVLLRSSVSPAAATEPPGKKFEDYQLLKGT